MPATYVPSTTVVCPEKLEEIMELNPDLPDGLWDASKGEMAEKEVYDFLQAYYSKKKGATLVIPPFKRQGQGELSKEQVALTKLIARARIHIERYNDRIKNFRLLG